MIQGVLISTVTIPATTYDLVEMETLKTLLGVTTTANDAYFSLVITQASKSAQNYCNNAFVVETLQDQVWPPRENAPWIFSADRNALQLARYPLTSITSVVETIAGTATTLVAGTDYIANMAFGQLTRLDSYGRPCNWNADPVVVTYAAGYSPIPVDVVDAVVEMVKLRWYSQTRDPLIRARNVSGIMETQYWFGSGPGSNAGIPSDIQAKLGNYRVPVIS